VPPEPIVLTVTLDPAQLELVASRVAELLQDGRDDGFLDIDGAASYLGRSKKSIYHLVERRKLPHHRAGGRLLFDPKHLRRWAERHG